MGRLYLIARQPYSLQETLDQAYGKILTPSESVLAFTLLSYIMVLVGFAAICAITARFQSHFQEVQEQQYESELETRELRIQVLESNMKSADLRLELLDRRYEKAQTNECHRKHHCRDWKRPSSMNPAGTRNSAKPENAEAEG